MPKGGAAINRRNIHTKERKKDGSLHLRLLQISARDGIRTSRSWLLPLENDSFDRDYKAQVDADIDHIVSICEMESQPIEHITEKEVVE